VHRLLRTAAPPLLAALLFSAMLTSHDRISTRLSWSGDVGPIMEARCVSCHAGAPVDLRAYVTARPWARAIREATLDGHAFSASNGAALTPFERELLVQWIDGGAPERMRSAGSPSAGPARYIRVATPAPMETLERYRQRAGGTPSIVPGLGLVLRTPDQLVIVERGAGAERVIANGEIVPSLARHLATLPSSVPRTRVSDAVFIIGDTRDPRREVAEIAPEGPDRFWCVMHPDVRSPVAGTCARCGMTLTALPPLSLDTFNLEIVNTQPSGPRVRVTLRVTRGADRRPVIAFLPVHERPFHLFVIDDELETFQHVHPDVTSTHLTAVIDAQPGKRYWLVGDFVPRDAMPQLRMARLPATPGGKGSTGDATAPDLRVHVSAGTHRAGRRSRLSFEVSEAASGASPSDLEPFLGAAAHLFVIDEALRNPMHAHPIELPAGGFAKPEFDVRFPRPGRYVMWLQLQRAGRVQTFRFTVDASN
jgi:hypothetical protein